MVKHIEWKPVVGYETLYEVSNDGQVRRSAPGHATYAGRVLKPNPGSDGYFRVVLCPGDGTRQPWMVHRLVAFAFIGPCAEGLECCHNDGNNQNNTVENLRWDTKSSNTLDAVRQGTNACAAKTHCPQGHPYDEANTAIENGARRCKACHRIREMAKRRAQGITPPTPKQCCPHGHPFTPENTFIRRGTMTRICRTCKRANATRQNARRRALKLARADIARG